jgi:peptidyl-prolyl cis-trans isomerase D
MLQRISDGLRGQKWLAWLILGLIAVVFVATGAWGVVDFEMNQSRYAVKADGVKVSADEAVRAWSERQSQWQQQFRTEMPADVRPKEQDELLESLITRALLQDRANKLGFRVSTDRLMLAIQQEQAFQVEGRYDAQLAKARLAQVGYTPQGYEIEKRQSLQVGQLQDGIRISNFMTSQELKRILDLQSQEREVAYVLLPAEQFAGTAPIDEAALEAYYNKNRDRFMSVESAVVDFAELRLETIAAQMTPSEQDLRKLYDQDKARFVQSERRRGRHILIQSADAKSDAEALKKAEAALADVRGGKDFAEVAKAVSQDAGTAPQGGDLGFAERGQFVGPFEEALFSMQPGEIRGPVKTQFGYHVIRLEEVEAGKTKSFDEARVDLAAQARSDMAADEFGSRQERLQQALEGAAPNLDALTQQFGMSRGEAPAFLRGGGGEPLGASQELQDVVFSDSVLNQKRIGGPVALGDDRIVVLRVKQHNPAAPKPLAEVREQIIASLRTERGTAAALAVAQKSLPELSSGALTLDTFAKAQGVKAEAKRFIGRGDPSVPAALRNAVFDTPKPAGSVASRTVSLDDGGVAVYQVSQVRADSASNPDLSKQLAQFVLATAGAGDLIAYLEEMRRRADVTKNPTVFQQ